MAAVNVSTGLRERQKAERRSLLLRIARELFETIGYDATTMSAIAARADVSTPTVFNYFGSKDDLMMAIIWEGHRKSREDLALKGVGVGQPLDVALTMFFQTITTNSLHIAGKRVWRFAEATNIRRPQSEFVKSYRKVDERLLEQLCAFLKGGEYVGRLSEACPPETVARVLYNHWNALFLTFIKDDGMTIAEHEAQVCSDMKALVQLIT